MPRLSHEQIKHGLLHEEVGVRTMVLEYFDRAGPHAATVMPEMIAAFQRFGHDKAFRFDLPTDYLSQTEESIGLMLSEASKITPTGKSVLFHRTLCRLLVGAEPALVFPHAAAIERIIGLSVEDHNLFARRRALATLDEAKLWHELYAFFEASKSFYDIEKFPYREGQAIVEELARRKVTITEEGMALLARYDDPDTANRELWLDPLLTRLVGLLRFEPAIPHLIPRLNFEGDQTRQEAAEALGRIGTTEVGQQLHARLASLDRLGLFFCEVVEYWAGDEPVQLGIDLFRRVQDADGQQFMAASLCNLIAPEANAEVYRVMKDDLEESVAQGHFLWSSTLMGLDYPILPALRAADAAMWVRRNPVERGPIPPPRPAPTGKVPNTPMKAAPLAAKTAGRNDPFPCRSGKKFKNCYLKK